MQFYNSEVNNAPNLIKTIRLAMEVNSIVVAV